MGSLADCPERTRVNEELDRAEFAIQQLRQINRDIEDLPWAVHLADEHRVTPTHAPRYAKKNWSAIKAAEGKSSKAIEHARVEDLCDLTEGLAKASTATRRAWELYHATWATVLASTAVEDAGRKPRVEPYSRRSIFKSMGEDREKACTAYKRLKTRPPRLKGKRSRNRLPSAEACAAISWEQSNPGLASIVTAVVLSKEHIPYLAQQAGLSIKDYLRQLRVGIDSLSATIAAAKLSGSQQVPRKKVKIDEMFVGRDLSLSGTQIQISSEGTLH